MTYIRFLALGCSIAAVSILTQPAEAGGSWGGGSSGGSWGGGSSGGYASSGGRGSSGGGLLSRLHAKHSGSYGGSSGGSWGGSWVDPWLDHGAVVAAVDPVADTPLAVEEVVAAVAC